MDKKKRTNRSLYMNKDEYEETVKKAKELGLSFGSYIRMKVL